MKIATKTKGIGAVWRRPYATKAYSAAIAHCRSAGPTFMRRETAYRPDGHATRPTTHLVPAFDTARQRRPNGSRLAAAFSPIQVSSTATGQELKDTKRHISRRAVGSHNP